MLTHPGLLRLIQEISDGQAQVVSVGPLGKAWGVVVVVEAPSGGPISPALERRLHAAMQQHRAAGTTLRVQSVG